MLLLLLLLHFHEIMNETQRVAFDQKIKKHWNIEGKREKKNQSSNVENQK